MQIARPFDIPVRIHWSFGMLMAGAMAWGGLRFGLPGFAAVTFAMVGLALSVILHELGHALAARRYGIGTEHITLYPMGGVAAIEEMPEDPDQETVIALAGPATNFLLAAIAGWIWLLTSSPYAMVFAISNLGLGALNLLPAYPMDGGRVLRALLARRMGWLPASRMAVKIGRAFAWAFIVGGLYWQQPTVVLTGIFLQVALNAEKKRLVAIHWERTTGRPPPWEQPAYAVVDR